MIASVSFVLTWNLICNFPQTGEISNSSLINMHEQTSNSQKNSNNANNISSSIMVLQTLIFNIVDKHEHLDVGVS